MPIQPGTHPISYQPGSMVYMLLYAFWVNWGPGNRGRTRLAVCPQLDDVLSSVHPRFWGNHKRTHTILTLLQTHTHTHTNDEIQIIKKLNIKK